MYLTDLNSDEVFKYFVGYQDDEIVKPWKNISFMVIYDVLGKYNKIWDKIKEKLNIKFHSKLVYDGTCINAKVREFDGMIKTNYLGNEVPKENMHYTCIACITTDSVMRMDKKTIRKFIYRNGNIE